MVLTNQDIENLTNLGYQSTFFVTRRNGWLQLKNKKGRCVFHDGLHCTIYRHRPEGCRLYPVVYDKDTRSAIIDNDCPQKQCFLLSKNKEQQLFALVFLLEKERRERMLKKHTPERKNSKRR
jgi:uncharacterized protein